MAFYLAQLAGGLSTVTALLCVQAKEAKMLLLGQLLANLLSGACYGLLGSFSGAWVCILAAIQTLLMFPINRMAAEKRAVWVKISGMMFSAAFILGTVLTYSRWPDVITCVCALLFVKTICQESTTQMRSVMILSMSLWIVFDIAVGAYASILTHGFTLCSLLLARFRLDRKACKSAA